MFDRDAYLIRIEYQGPATPSVEALRGLHRAHVMTVPFENLNIHLGRPVSLDPSDLFRKIVVERRGGYCFELNGLFALLLEDIGFTVTRLAARVLYGMEGMRPRSHQLLLVHLGEERWLADVGFGGQGLREPFPFMAGLEQRQGPDQFRLATDERKESVLQWHMEETWVDLYSFALDPWLPVDYSFANYYHSHSPDSLFTQQRICTMPTPEGRTSLIDNVLKVRGRDGKQERHVADEEYKQLLQQHFGLIIHEHVKC